MWLFLEILIVTQVLYVPELITNMNRFIIVILSMSSTIMFIILKLLEVKWLSSEFGEGMLVHIMGKMTASSNWIPY